MAALPGRPPNLPRLLHLLHPHYIVTTRSGRPYQQGRLRSRRFRRDALCGCGALLPVLLIDEFIDFCTCVGFFRPVYPYRSTCWGGTVATVFAPLPNTQTTDPITRQSRSQAPPYYVSIAVICRYIINQYTTDLSPIHSRYNRGLNRWSSKQALS